MGKTVPAWRRLSAFSGMTSQLIIGNQVYRFWAGKFFIGVLMATLFSCASNGSETFNFNRMSDQEIIAYNRTQDRIWDQIFCVREVRTESRIKKRYCATLSQLNRRMATTGEQLNIISFGTPQIWH
jgi:hypothetical protein|tara:strand:- start:819 stop:1196 length:378 start_codon:yes stop_codon:yes gene_type:complete